MKNTAVLNDLRNNIDSLDDQILELLQQRAQVAIDIGRVKKEHSIAVLDRGRERNVLGRLMDKAQDQPLNGDAVRGIFGEIIKACRAAQAPIRVAFLGPTGTFSHAAAHYQFGALGHYVPIDDLPAVFKEVEEGRADLGVVPFENSVEGIVGLTLDMLSQTKLKARGMLNFKVSLALMSKGRDAAAVKKVASHPQALAQCRGWLSLNLPGVELITTNSTAAATSLTADDPSMAVVGHPILADIYDLNIVAENIEDHSHNQTFFLVMGSDHSEPSGNDKTMAWFTTPHSSGSLYACLQPLADAGVNMSRLHSRPAQGQPWEYRFFLELDGHFTDPSVAEALKILENSSEKYYLLGSYESIETVASHSGAKAGLGLFVS